MDSKIIAFLRDQNVLALSVCDGEEIHAASCFYALDEEEIALIFASNPDTKHMEMIDRSSQVAGVIHLCTETVSRIQGVQFRGKVKPATQEQKRLYLARFPIAKTMDPAVWAIRLEWIKYTDNRLGFGRKLIWTRRSDR